ncbi:MAG: glycosyltransferase family A protein [Rhodobacterales bacterium]|nr:glycosyltransferase family A protein [Rhodobacterales bacterium]
MYLISLTAIPPRFDELSPCLEALCSQSVKPEAVLLYIPKKYRRFPDWDGTLPKVPKGVEIRRPEEDLGPATKVLFAADDFRGKDTRILFCDDDRIYLPDWSRRFLDASDRKPGSAIVSAGFELSRIGLGWEGKKESPRGRPLRKTWDIKYHWERLQQNIAHGGRRKVPYSKKAPRNFYWRSGFVDIGEGFGGFLIRPDYLGRDTWDIPSVMWAVDDVWISGQLARKGIAIWAEAGASRFLTSTSQKLSALHNAIIDGADREQANRACAIYMRDTLGIWGSKQPTSGQSGQSA